MRGWVWLLAACMTACAVRETSDDVEDDGAAPRTCSEDSPPLGCAYDEVSFGPCGDAPTSELDENCCRRPFCERHADCAEGLVCNLGGIYGFSCSEVQADGEPSCQCGAPLLGLARPMCIPASVVSPAWCSALRTETECAGEPIDLGGGDVRSCRWVEAQELTLDPELGCAITPSFARCVTVQHGAAQGCERSCRRGELELADARVRPLRPGAFELLDIDTCDGSPVGEWLALDDPSLADCVFDCSP
ncbi:MAG: hypothetical protein IAG13_20480 [Deltaproteobacteria bacterium]|nr:hypothetical protein [Nannocystaceae bacterium]